LATTSEVGAINVWDAESGAVLLSLIAHTSEDLPGLAFSPNGERLVSIGGDDQAIIWDAGSGQFITSMDTPLSPTNVTFSPDGRLLAVSGDAGTIQIWDVSNDQTQLLVTIAGHRTEVTDLVFSPDGAQLASSSLDGTIIVWDVAQSINEGAGRAWFTLVPHNGAVLSLDYSPDGRSLATAGEDGVVHVTLTNLEETMALAQERLTRGFTEAECRQYLHLDACPDQP
jgi:WD40 repeat protein